MSNALALITVDDTVRVASALVKSGLLPKSIDTPEKAFAIITLGQELGFAAWQSINSIDVIQGKPTLKPQAMLALIHKSGLAEHIQIPDVGDIAQAGAATVTMARRGGMAHTETFTWEMAQSMLTTEWVNGQKKSVPLTEKYNWKTMPEIMMKWRAVSACARVVFPDVIMGMYTSDEIDADSVTASDVRDERPAPIDAPQLAPGESDIPQYYDENGDDLPEETFEPEPGKNTFLGRAISAETRKVKNGKAIDLRFASGGVVTIFTREALRKLSPLWADTVKTWDQPGEHYFVDVAGELDVFSNGKSLEFVIPAKYLRLHAVPDEVPA